VELARDQFFLLQCRTRGAKITPLFSTGA
jgi:hypothetical protein